MRRIGLICASLLTGLLGFTTWALAALHVDVTQGNVQPMPIAIPDFLGGPRGGQIAGVVRADLERSGLFRPLDQKSYLEQIRDINTPPQFNNWRVINAQALVTGQATAQPDGRLRADFRLWDVYGEQQMLGLSFSTAPKRSGSSRCFPRFQSSASARFGSTAAPGAMRVSRTCSGRRGRC